MGGSGSSPGQGMSWCNAEPRGLSGRAGVVIVGARGAEWGELGLLFHFLGSVFGTESWQRPQRAADSHLRETDKESTFCQQTPAQLPQHRRGEEEELGGRKEREVHRLPMEERRGRRAAAGSGADPELPWQQRRSSSGFCEGSGGKGTCSQPGLCGDHPLPWPVKGGPSISPNKASGSRSFANEAVGGHVSAGLVVVVGQDLALAL